MAEAAERVEHTITARCEKVIRKLCREELTRTKLVEAAEAKAAKAAGDLRPYLAATFAVSCLALACALGLPQRRPK